MKNKILLVVLVIFVLSMFLSACAAPERMENEAIRNSYKTASNVQVAQIIAETDDSYVLKFSDGSRICYITSSKYRYNSSSIWCTQ